MDLAPINDVTDCEEHIKALQWALSNSNIKNVALTGPYGSGKSSIIQTFLDNNPLIRDKSIQVSLATFSDKEDIASLDLEEGILKQLFYKVKQNKIPQSRYRKIHRVSYRGVLAITTICVLLVGIMVFVFWPTGLEFIHNSVVEAGSKVKLSPIFSLSFFTVLIAGILAVIAKITQLCAFRFYIKDLKLPKEAGTVSSEPKENEILNKKIDEIVYFFEETRFRFVFFEDLDRFNEPEVFVKLREINTLLNNYDAIKENIVFIYAIKDEMFVGVERTKFFDFIIPVIPVINSTNSGEMLLSLLNIEEGQSTKHNISQEYIFDVSPFISDMRVLYNIYNEFLLYKQTIKTNQGVTTLKDSVMMSLIIFKNLQPDQFAKLQNEEGVVKAAFNLKATFVDTRRKEIQSEINEHVQVLESIENDTLNSQYELKYALLCAMTGWKGMVYSLRRNGYRTMYARKILESNSDMIYRVVEYKNATLCSALNSKNYTTITELGYTPLLEYVHKNFGLYTDTIVMQEDNTKEAAHSVLEMLDRSIDDLERCNRIITHIDFNLDAVTEVCKEHISGNSVDVQKVWDMLLGNERLNVSWCAIYGYWKTFGLSAELCNYIVRHADILANKDASCLDDDFKECIILSGMDIEPFKMILPQIRMEAFTVGIDKIEREKLKVMVHNRSFNFTVVDYEEMDQYAPELCEQFILLNQQEFDEVFDQITLKAKVFESLVISKDLSNTIKERLIARDGVDLMTEKVASYLCSAEIDINRDVFATAWEMLEDTRRRKDLLFKYLEILELEDFEQYLVELDGPYKDLERRSYRHDVIIPDNQANRHLVSRLQLVRFLTSIAYETQTWYNPEREIPVIRCRVKAKQAGSTSRSKH